MTIIFFILAVISIVIANALKVKRLSLFIESYEPVKYKVLFKSLAFSNFLNLVLPFRLGNIYRAYYSGKKMNYGISFSFATIVAEIFLDFCYVLLIYVIFGLLGINSLSSIIFYLICIFIVALLIILCIVFKKHIKKAIYNISKIFNDSIELKILKTTWFTILSLKNIVIKVNKIKLTFLSILVWMLNICSCLFLAYSLNLAVDSGLHDIFNMFFSNSGVTSNILLNILKMPSNMLYYLFGYYALSIIFLWLLSYLVKDKKADKEYALLLPHQNLNDRLQFLKLYFNSNDNGAYFNKYLELNHYIAIIEDYSAGSNATTMLCSKDGKLFYRKYSFGDDANKLHDQIEWIHDHEKRLTLTKIINESFSDSVCAYDMPYVQGAVTCFNYVHTMPFDDAWNVLKTALDDISNNLHTINRRKADFKTIDEYIKNKVLNNIEKIEKSKYIKPLLKYDYIYINGQKYHNLSYLKKYLNADNLKEIFKNDYYSDIHGDFTIENIICLKNNEIDGKNYYIIDPNTGNVHDSPYLDYGKLLQSIHGGYEFLMNTKAVSCTDDRIDFLFTKSSTYYKLFENLVEYLETQFGQEGLKSIFYHEIIHWLRLMPYKIEKNGERSLLFYAGLIIVANDVIERFENENSNV